MVKAELVLAKLQKLEERAERVRTHARTTAAELESDRDALDVVTLNLMLCVQAGLDIASHIIGDEGWRLATTLGDSFERLHEHGVLSRTTANALKNAAGLRNIVVHALTTPLTSRSFTQAPPMGSATSTRSRAKSRSG